MKKRRVILLAAILALASVVTISVWPDASPEPRYNGRKLSDWVLDYPQAGASDEAEAAIRAIGTNAIPCLLRWIQYEPSRGRMKVRHVYRLLPGWLRNRQFVISFLAGRAGILSSKAPLAFAVLGTNSAPAVPELMKLAQSTNSVALTAVFVLSEMRDAGLSGTLTIMTMELYSNDCWLPEFCRRLCPCTQTPYRLFPRL